MKHMECKEVWSEIWQDFDYEFKKKVSFPKQMYTF